MVEHEVKQTTSSEFLSGLYDERKPCIIKGVDLGPAPVLWTSEYLMEHCRGDREVKVHVCPTRRMDFINKNFCYRTLPFKEFIKRSSQLITATDITDRTDYFICPEERYYLRALGGDPRKEPAQFPVQYPELANDLIFPVLPVEKEKIFSSVLRVSSPNCQLWTHYDVMDNFLIQIRGTKRVVLFHPKDALSLYMVGDKSSILDIETPDLEKYPLFKNVDSYMCHIQPGDVLFIPSLWFHNVFMYDFSVAVNIFWKHLEPQYYDLKDPYGNKDPLQVQRAMQTLEKALKHIDELPDDFYKDFYAKYMINTIQKRNYYERCS